MGTLADPECFFPAVFAGTGVGYFSPGFDRRRVHPVWPATLPGSFRSSPGSSGPRLVHLDPCHPAGAGCDRRCRRDRMALRTPLLWLVVSPFLGGGVDQWAHGPGTRPTNALGTRFRLGWLVVLDCGGGLVADHGFCLVGIPSHLSPAARRNFL